MTDKNGYKDKFLQSGEKVVYKTEPQSKSRYVSSLIGVFVLSLLCLLGDCFAVGVSFAMGIADKTKWYITVIFVLIIIIHVIPEGVWLMRIIDKQTELNETEYFLTDKRIIVASRRTENYFFQCVDIAEVRSYRVKAKSNGFFDLTVYTDTDKICLYSLKSPDKILGVLDIAIDEYENPQDEEIIDE